MLQKSMSVAGKYECCRKVLVLNCLVSLCFMFTSPTLPLNVNHLVLPCFLVAAATPPSDPEIEGLKLQIFKSYVKAREEQGFEGSLMQYLQHVDVQNKIKLMEVRGWRSRV